MNQVDHKEFTNLIFYSLNLLQLQIWGKLNSLSESSKSSSNLLILNYFLPFIVDLVTQWFIEFMEKKVMKVRIKY